MRVVFMGTPDFGVRALEKLNEQFEVVLVVTQPDRKVGRKRFITPTPIKEAAVRMGISVFQPEKIKDDYNAIIEAKPDLIVTAAYGQFVPTKVLNVPKLGAVNIHASLLPKYRGGSPIHASIKNGDEYTGISIIYMVKKMDAGDVLAQEKVKIESDDTALSMFDKLGFVGADLLINTVDKLILGEVEATPQNTELVTFAPNIQRIDELINWEQTAKEVDAHVRGFHSWPGTYSVMDDVKVKIFPGIIKDESGQPGEVLDVSKEGLLIGCAEGSYLITELQVQGKKRMFVKDFLNGNKLIIKGEFFSK